MDTQIIDGNPVGARYREAVKQQALAFKEQYGFAPGLGVVLVGDDPASEMYVNMKRRACERVGLASFAHVLPQTVSHDEVMQAVQTMNDDPKIHGILVQLPMPKQINEDEILSYVRAEKDVDGFHPHNIGALAMKGREPLFTPATPTGIMILLEEMGVNLDGANAVVMGRSNIVGMPVALLLMRANATVSVVHSHTHNPQEIVKRADVLITAMGKPNYVPREWLKEGVFIVDVGTNKVDDPQSPNGYTYVGDVDLQGAMGVARAITKVPGGVGPMTITLLLMNTLKAAQRLMKDNA
ncbi:MAG: bifunctional 5,10-methylenetetrahydrofolate dehydrogenase/5,10-methenyltetrahydrofolate cyclohydrolase [Phototrophicaceae bacterium]